MQVFIFRSDKDQGVYGFTAARDGANLPAEFSPWKPQGGSAMAVGTAVAGIGPSDAILASIATDGFYVSRTSGVIISRSGSA
jgi:hypothetical protein